MKKLIISLAVTVLVVGLSVGGAFAKSEKQSATVQACVLLPDTKSSVRWETQDRPTFIAAFKKANITATVVNAEGDAQRQRSQADQCLANGAKVILLTSLDPGSGCAIIKAATARKVKTIDYDRLNTGCKGANYYVSFNNPTVGRLMGLGVKAAMTAKGLLSGGNKPVIAYLNGGPTDNNSKLFKQGYASVLDPLIKSGKATKGPDRVCPVGQPEGTHGLRADARLHRQQDRRGRGGQRRPRERGRDRAQGEEAEPDPALRAGCDGPGRAEHHLRLAVRDGVQAREDRGPAAAAVAVALLKGGSPKVNGTTNNGVRNVPSVLATPIWITKATIPLLYKDGQFKKSEVCVGSYKQYC